MTLLPMRRNVGGGTLLELVLVVLILGVLVMTQVHRGFKTLERTQEFVGMPSARQTSGAYTRSQAAPAPDSLLRKLDREAGRAARKAEAVGGTALYRTKTFLEEQFEISTRPGGEGGRKRLCVGRYCV